jgi:hypothetical protein
MANSILTPDSANIFEDLRFSPEEAEHLIIRADLMLSIRRRIENQNWIIEQAAIKYQTSADRYWFRYIRQIIFKSCPGIGFSHF